MDYDETDEMYKQIMEKWMRENESEVKKRSDEISLLSDMEEEDEAKRRKARTRIKAGLDPINDEEWEEEEPEVDLDKIIEEAVGRAEKRYDIAAVTSVERTALPPIPEPFTIAYRFLSRKFNEWKARERERRMAGPLKHYQHKVLAMEKKLKEDYIQELREVSGVRLRHT